MKKCPKGYKYSKSLKMCVIKDYKPIRFARFFDKSKPEEPKNNNGNGNGGNAGGNGGGGNGNGN